MIAFIFLQWNVCFAEINELNFRWYLSYPLSQENNTQTEKYMAEQ